MQYSLSNKCKWKRHSAPFLLIHVGALRIDPQTQIAAVKIGQSKIVVIVYLSSAVFYEGI